MKKSFIFDIVILRGIILYFLAPVILLLLITHNVDTSFVIGSFSLIIFLIVEMVHRDSETIEFEEPVSDIKYIVTAKISGSDKKIIRVVSPEDFEEEVINNLIDNTTSAEIIDLSLVNVLDNSNQEGLEDLKKSINIEIANGINRKEK